MRPHAQHVQVHELRSAYEHEYLEASALTAALDAWKEYRCADGRVRHNATYRLACWTPGRHGSSLDILAIFFETLFRIV